MEAGMSDWVWPNGGTVAPTLPGRTKSGFRSTSEYGYRAPIDTNGDGRPDTSAFHTGLDTVGYSLVVAIGEGIVTRVGYTAADGWAVHIDHGYGVTSESIHLKAGSIRVAVGQKVTARTPLGTMGATGLANGVHLHQRIKFYGTLTDPRAFLTALVGKGGGTAGGGVTPIPIEEEEMSGPQYVFTDQDGIGYALIDSEYVDGCIVTSDPREAEQFSYLAWTPTSQGAPWKLDRKLFNAKCAAALALKRKYAPQSSSGAPTASAIADEVLAKLNATIATDADIAAMRAEILAAVEAVPELVIVEQKKPGN